MLNRLWRYINTNSNKVDHLTWTIYFVINMAHKHNARAGENVMTRKTEKQPLDINIKKVTDSINTIAFEMSALVHPSFESVSDSDYSPVKSWLQGQIRDAKYNMLINADKESYFKCELEEHVEKTAQRPDESLSEPADAKIDSLQARLGYYMVAHATNQHIKATCQKLYTEMFNETFEPEIHLKDRKVVTRSKQTYSMANAQKTLDKFAKLKQA